MTNQTLSVGSTPRIVVEAVKGDLSIVGWDAQELLIKADDENVRVQQDDQAVSISCDDDLTLRMPRGGSVNVRSVAGDMALRGVTGQVEIKAVQGDLSMRDIGPTIIERVSADFSLRGASGNLQIKKISGDASVRDASGDVMIDLVASDLVVRGVGGNLKAAAGADAIIYLDPNADHEYSVNAGDDILAILPPDADATLNLTGDEIEVNLPGISSEDATSRVVTLGNGSAKIFLSAGSDLRVSGHETAAESADEFGNLAGAMFDWNDFGRELGDRISQRVNEATRRAEQKITRKIRSKRWNVGIDSAAMQGAGQPVSDEERMTILKMLQEKKITAEDAEKLLSALEGGE